MVTHAAAAAVEHLSLDGIQLSEQASVSSLPKSLSTLDEHSAAIETYALDEACAEAACGACGPRCEHAAARIRRRVRAALAHPVTHGVMLSLTIFALFATDVLHLGVDDSVDEGVATANAVIFFTFCVEIFAQCAVVPSYSFSFFFWMDLLGTLSITLEIPWMADPLFAALGLSSASGGEDVHIAGKSSRVGAKAAKVVRLLRVVRLMRLFRVLRVMRYLLEFVRARVIAGFGPIGRGCSWQCCPTAKRSSHEDVGVAQTPVSATRRRRLSIDDDGAAIGAHPEKALTAHFADVVNRRVVVIVLFFVFASPFLTHFDAIEAHVAQAQEELQYWHAADPPVFNGMVARALENAVLPMLYLRVGAFEYVPCEGIATYDVAPEEVARARAEYPELPLCGAPDIYGSVRYNEILTVRVSPEEAAGAAATEGGLFSNLALESSLAKYDRAASMREEALLSIVMTLCILSVLVLGTLLLSWDARRLLLLPLEKYVAALNHQILHVRTLVLATACEHEAAATAAVSDMSGVDAAPSPVASPTAAKAAARLARVDERLHYQLDRDFPQGEAAGGAGASDTDFSSNMETDEGIGDDGVISPSASFSVRVSTSNRLGMGLASSATPSPEPHYQYNNTVSSLQGEQLKRQVKHALARERSAAAGSSDAVNTLQQAQDYLHELGQGLADFLAGKEGMGERTAPPRPGEMSARLEARRRALLRRRERQARITRGAGDTEGTDGRSHRTELSVRRRQTFFGSGGRQRAASAAKDGNIGEDSDAEARASGERGGGGGGRRESGGYASEGDAF